MLRSIQNNFAVQVFICIVVGMLFGLFFWEEYMITWSSRFLIFLLFCSMTIAFLKIDLKDFKQSLKSFDLIAGISFGKLVVLPLIVFGLSFFIPSEFRIGLVLLALAPAPMAAPGLALMLRSNINLSLAVTVLTNFLIPFTLPLLLAYMFGANIEMDLWSMFGFLLFMIVVPLGVAMIIRFFFGGIHRGIVTHSKSLMTFIMSVFFIGVFAPYAEMIVSEWSDSLIILFFVGIFWLLSHLFAWAIVYKSKLENVVASSVLIVYSNTGLIILLAMQYFDERTALITVLYEVFWAIGIVLMQKFFARK